MFEHMKNYQMLLRKVSTWLRPKSTKSSDEALLFVHIFVHRTTPYHFEDGDGWMAQTFFSGLSLFSKYDAQLLIGTTVFRRNYAIPRSPCRSLMNYTIITAYIFVLPALLPIGLDVG